MRPQLVSEDVLTDVERTIFELHWSDEPTDGKTLYTLLSRSGYTDYAGHDADAYSDDFLSELSDHAIK